MMSIERWIPDQVRDDEEVGQPPAWVTPFPTGLIVTGSLRQALMYWERALRVHKGVMAGFDLLDAAEREEVRVPR